MRRISVLLLILFISFCGGSEVSNNESLISSTSTTTTTVADSTTTSTTTTTVADSTTTSTTTTTSSTTTTSTTTTTVVSVDYPQLIISEISSSIPEYDRDDWNHWIDENGDCQNTRHENLQLESFIKVNFTDDSNCYVSSGKWFDPFNGIYLYEASKIDIDHFVPLYNVHISGGWAWSEEKKTIFANNLNDPDILIAVKSSTNREKSSHAPDKWKPANRSYWCEYAYDWIRIKHEWELSVTQEEWNALDEMLDTCPNEFFYEDAKNKSHLFSDERISKYLN